MVYDKKKEDEKDNYVMKVFAIENLLTNKLE